MKVVLVSLYLKQITPCRHGVDRTHVPINLHIIIGTQIGTESCDVEATFCLNVINPYLG
jgi:hypothetical protein